MNTHREDELIRIQSKLDKVTTYARRLQQLNDKMQLYITGKLLKTEDSQDPTSLS